LIGLFGQRQQGFLAESAAESGQGVVVRMPVAGDEPKRQRVVGGPFDLAARMRAGGVAILIS
jgi:hypothetical protein